MAKYDLKFLDYFQEGLFIKCENVSFSDLDCVEEHINYQDMIHITLNGLNGIVTTICLDKSTAIKFAKTLRTEINKMED
jgi:hypothetical protein